MSSRYAPVSTRYPAPYARKAASAPSVVYVTAPILSVRATQVVLRRPPVARVLTQHDSLVGLRYGYEEGGDSPSLVSPNKMERHTLVNSSC